MKILVIVGCVWLGFIAAVAAWAVTVCVIIPWRTGHAPRRRWWNILSPQRNHGNGDTPSGRSLKRSHPKPERIDQNAERTARSSKRSA